jgi:hypothetical protein
MAVLAVHMDFARARLVLLERYVQQVKTNSTFLKFDYYFNIEDIGLNYSLDTAILTQNEIGSLFSMTGRIRTNLLYRASRDGFTGAAFHARCDYKARTITLVKTKENYVFGGFTSSLWELKSNTGSYSSDSHSFLFSLRRAGTSNTICTSYANCNNKFPLRSISATYTNYAVYSHPSNGPSFGNTDIYIPNRSDTNYAQTSYNTYSASNTYLAGTNRFYASEIEVFQIECTCQNQYTCSNVYPPFDSCGKYVYYLTESTHI